MKAYLDNRLTNVKADHSMNSDPRIVRVVDERRRRAWSRRKAAEMGGTSHTSWCNFEQLGILGSAMKGAVARAFEWPEDWYVELPPPPVNELEARLAAIEARLAELEGGGRRKPQR